MCLAVTGLALGYVLFSKIQLINRNGSVLSLNQLPIRVANVVSKASIVSDCVVKHRMVRHTDDQHWHDLSSVTRVLINNLSIYLHSQSKFGWFAGIHIWERWAIRIEPPLQGFTLSQLADTISHKVRHGAIHVLECIKFILDICTYGYRRPGIVQDHGNIQVQTITVDDEWSREANITRYFGSLSKFELHSSDICSPSRSLSCNPHLFQLASGNCCVDASGNECQPRSHRKPYLLAMTAIIAAIAVSLRCLWYLQFGL